MQVLQEQFMQITLLRHGKPEFELTGKVRANELGEIVRSYDMSGIIGTPPVEAINQIQAHDIVVCSDLPRSIQSAKALGVTEIHSANSIFREINIPYFSNSSIKLPVKTWLIILRGLWFLGFAKNGESQLAARMRAKQATQELIQIAQQYGSVLLVGHGFNNYFVARQLLSLNWTGPKKPASNYWDYSVYQYN